jgi:hypothetical protein
MQKDSTTTIWVNKVKIAFSKKKMTAYGGLSLMAAFFKQIRLREAIERVVPVREVSPNSTGIYGKIMMYFSMVYAGERFAHVGHLGNKTVGKRLEKTGLPSILPFLYDTARGGSKESLLPEEAWKTEPSPPLIAFLNKSKFVIHLWNRSGNVTSWNNIIAFFTESFYRVSAHWFRKDTGERSVERLSSVVP